MPWKEIYWKMWAKTKVFKCRNCQKYYRPTETKFECRYHPCEAWHRFGENEGTYECCKAKIKKFDVGITIKEPTYDDIDINLDEINIDNQLTSMSALGCKHADHVVDTKHFPYLTPEISTNTDISEKEIRLCFEEDLECFWRNKDLILKISDIPKLKTGHNKLEAIETDDSIDEFEEYFVQYKSR